MTARERVRETKLAALLLSSFLLSPPKAELSPEWRKPGTGKGCKSPFQKSLGCQPGRRMRKCWSWAVPAAVLQPQAHGTGIGAVHPCPVLGWGVAQGPGAGELPCPELAWLRSLGTHLLCPQPRCGAPGAATCPPALLSTLMHFAFTGPHPSSCPRAALYLITSFIRHLSAKTTSISSCRALLSLLFISQSS